MSGAAGLGATSCGVWTRGQALEVMSRSQVQSALRSGRWQQLWPGTYAEATCEPDVEQRAFAAVLASGGAGQPVPLVPGGGPRRRLRAVACGRTAARVHGFPLIDDRDAATGAQDDLFDDVALWRHGVGLHQREVDGRLRTLARSAPTWKEGDIERQPSGLYITSPLRTLIDCAGLLSVTALVCAVDDALHRRLVTPEGLAAELRSRPGGRNIAALQVGITLADGRAESPAETLARLLALPVVPDLVPQHRLWIDGRVVARFDLASTALRLAVEADGRAGHAGERMAAKDQMRDRLSDSVGWRTERCTWRELRCQRDAFIRRIVEAAADQRRRHGL